MAKAAVPVLMDRPVPRQGRFVAVASAGGTVGILPDQKPRAGEGEFAPFFGRDALTMVLLPRLAARTGATVLFAFAERLPEGAGYRIHLLPAPEGGRARPSVQ